MINFGVAILIGLASYLVIFSIVVIVKKIFKKVIIEKIIQDINWAYGFAAFLLLYLVSLLVVYLTYSRTTYFSLISMAVATSLVVIFVPFKSFINKIRAKQIKEVNKFNFVKYAGIILILLLEVFAFSNVSSKKDNGLIEVPFNSELILRSDANVKDGKMVFDRQRQYFILDNREHSFSNIYLDLECDVETKTQIDFFVSKDDDKYEYAFSYPSNPNFDEFEYYDISEISGEDYIQVVVVIDETNVHDSGKIPAVRLKQIAINRAFPFVFNALRLVIVEAIFLTVMIVIKKGRQLKFKSTNNLAILERIILLLCGVGLVFVLVEALINSSTHFVSVNDINNAESPIYYQLFHALKKGQMHLDIEPSAELLALENPYDPSARTGVSYLWDHAFFNGKYYCYYGAAPVFLVMFPIYYLSGMKMIPSILLIQEIGTLFSILTFLLVLVNLTKLMFKEVNMPTLILLLVGATFSSLLLSNTIFKVGWYNEGIYRIPYSYGLCFYFLTLLMILKAFNNSRFRILFLGLAGLSVVLMMASRPTLIIGFVLFIPLFIKILLEKYPWKRKLIDFAPMVGVVILGAVILCYYNYARFNSITEFGQSYQLTVVDGTTLSYSLEGVFPTLANYYLMPPYLDGGMFPNIDYGWGDFAPAYHSYNAGSIGILMIPMMWGIFALPFVFNKEDNLYLRIMLYAAPFVIFFIAYTTYCFGGTCPRYVVEITALSMLFGFIPLLKTFDLLYKRKPITSVVLLILSVSVSFVIGFSLLFTNFDGWNEGGQLGLLEVIRSIFNQYNI